MLMIMGAVLICVGIAMTYIFIRNSKRPRMEVQINSVHLDHVKQDKKKAGPKHPHGTAKYNFDGVNYESSFLLKVKNVSEGDWVEVTVNPNKPEDLTIYAPRKEKQVILAIYLVGAGLIGGSWFIMSYFELW